MLTTILAQGGSLFDRRTLISAFLPAMVFWAAASAVVLLELVGWQTGLRNWQALGGTAQGLALMAFFVWVGLWTFLTVGMRARMTRLLEGYGPARGLAGAVRDRMCRRHLNTVGALQREDAGLEQRHVALLATAETLRLPHGGGPGQEQPPGNADDLDRLLSELDPVAPGTGDEQLAELADRASGWWRWLAAQQSVPPVPAPQQRRRLSRVTRALADEVELRLHTVESRRAGLLAQLAAFPADRARIMPTRLGNVVRAAEEYGAERYGMDAVLVWPRLHPLLPASVVSAEEQARTAIDLLLTVSVSAVLFGVPIAAGVGLSADRSLAWWAPAAALLAALAVRTLPAAITAAMALVARIPVLPDGWLSGPASTRLQISLTALSIALLVAAVTYRAAVESAGPWGEQLKAALDLYRWKLLDAMNIRRPADATEERRVWAELTGLLDRGYAPDVGLFRYIGGENQASDSSVSPCRVAVPARTLPAFQPITTADVEERWVWRSVPDELYAVMTADLTGRQPLQPLPAGQPVPTRLLIGPSDMGNGAALTAVGVQVAPADGLGGTLRGGDRIQLTLFDADSAPLRTLPDVLVLRYIPARSDAPADSGGRDTLVVAVPPELAAELVAMTRRATAAASWPLPLGGGPAAAYQEVTHP